MTERLKTPTPWLAAGVVWLAVQVLLQRRGLVAHDTRLDLLLNPADFLARASHVWDAQADMGRVPNQAVGYLFPMGPFMLIGNALAIPAWITERLWMALLLGLAFWGTARVADGLSVGTPVTRLLGAASYALSPFFITRVGNTSGFVLGAALLPWVLLPLIRGTFRGSPRRAAFASGIAILAIGGINAAETAAVLVVPLLWLLTRARGPRRASLVRWWLLATVLATSWWAAALVLQGRYGLDFLPLTERAGLTTAPTSPFDVVRGAADWLAHIIVGDPQLPAGWTLVSSRPIIAATGLVAALAGFGLAHRDIPERRFLTTTFLVGVALVGVGYGGFLGNPLATAAVAFLDGPGGAFRTVYKFQPVVMLPLAMGVTHGAAVTLAAVARWRPERAAYGTGVLLLLGALLVGSAQPLFAQDLLNAKPFSRVPDWWTQAADSIANAPGRTLLVPGLPQADSTWGYTGEEPLSWLTNESWASRSLIPLGSYGAISYLDTVEEAIARGGDRSLPGYLERGGFARVMVRNDGEWNLYGAPPPSTVTDAVDASGFVHVASFGPELTQAEAGGSTVRPLHQIEMYSVPGVGAETRVTTYDAGTTAVVSGDPAAPLGLESWNADDRGLILASDLQGNDTLPSQWIVTDGNRRRFIDFGTTRHNASYVTAPDENAPGGFARDGMFPNARVQDQTVAVRDGIAGVSASTYGSVARAEPQWAPAQALDGDVSTAWVPAIEVPVAGQWLQVDLSGRVPVSSMDVQLLTPLDRADAVLALRITTEQGTEVSTVDQSATTQHPKVPAGMTSWIRVTLESTSPLLRRAGIRELSIPGVTVHQALEAPSQLTTQFTDPALPMPEYLFSRVLPNPISGEQIDPEPALRRRFTVPHDGLVNVAAKAAIAPGAAALELVDSSPLFTVSATSTFGSLPRLAPRNLVDGDATTSWVSGMLDDGITPDPDPHLLMQWSGSRQIDSVELRAAPGHELPRSVRITGDGEERTAQISPEGHAEFAPMTTDRVVVDFILPPAPASRRAASEDAAAMRVGLSELSFPALRDLAPALSDRTRVVSADCVSGPAVEFAGTQRRFSVTATVDDVENLRAVDARPCDDSPVVLSAGTHELSSPTSATPFVVTGIRLTDVAVKAPSSSPSRGTEVRTWGTESRSVEIGPGAASYLAVNENANDGWMATLNGHGLESVVLDGWRQGYLVPAGAGGVVQLSYEPATRNRAGLLGGLALVLLLVIGRLLPDRKRSRALSGVEEGTWSRWVAIAAPAALALLIGGPLALLLVGLLGLRRHLSAWVPALIAVLLVGAAAGATLHYGPDNHALWGSNGRIVSALVVSAMAALASTLVRPPKKRLSGV